MNMHHINLVLPDFASRGPPTSCTCVANVANPGAAVKHRTMWKLRRHRIYHHEMRLFTRGPLPEGLATEKKKNEIKNYARRALSPMTVDAASSEQR